MAKLKQIKEIPTYLVDFSFYMYMTVHSTLKEFEYHFSPILPKIDKANRCLQGGAKPFDPTTNEDFCYMLTDNIKSRILGIVKKKSGMMAGLNNVILCLDMERYNIWRKDYLPEYKSNRDSKPPSKFDVGACFKYVRDYILQMLQDNGATVISNPVAEADDCIAVIVQKARETEQAAMKGESIETGEFEGLYVPENFIIVSCDHDLLQLTSENTKQVGKYPYDFIERPKGMSPNQFVMKKVITGDKGDNVQGLQQPKKKGGWKPIGQKGYEKLIEDNHKGLKKLLSESPQQLEQYKLNRKIMDLHLEFLPEIIIDDVWDQFKAKRPDLFKEIPEIEIDEFGDL
jgi:5'-3' exonuclease